MKQYTEAQAALITPHHYAVATNNSGTSIIKAHLRENAVVALQKRHPEENITDNDVYAYDGFTAATSCDELTRVDFGWDADKQEHVEYFSFLLPETAEKYRR